MILPAIACATLLVAGCSSNDNGNGSADQGSDQGDTPAPVAGTPAEAEVSPPAAANLPGSSSKVNSVANGAAIIGAARVGLNGTGNNDMVAVLSPGKLDYVAASNRKTPNPRTLDGSCDHISTTATGVAVSCKDKVIEYNAQGEETRTINTDGTVTSATIAQDGDALLGKKDSDRVYFITPDGKQTKDEIVSRSIDQTVLVRPTEGKEKVAVIDRGQTSINDVSLADEAYTASLRIGQGVGMAASGRGDDGVVVASDTRQNQVMLYTMNDVVRLHQSAPTGASPWAVAWDSNRSVVWVSTTHDNKITAYKVSNGTPEKVAQFDSIANVRGLFVTGDGGLVVVGKTGDVQKLSGDEVKGLVKPGPPNQRDGDYPARPVGDGN